MVTTSMAPLAYRGATIHFLLVIGWTAYVVHLPGMLDRVGLPRDWLIWLLLLDQAAFALSDWFFGLIADRLGRAVAPMCRAIMAASIASSLAVLAMPWFAQAAHASALLMAMAVWAILSSALRAPVFALLSRESGTVAKASLVGWLLAGAGLANALSPWVGARMKELDPRVALAIAAVLLALGAIHLCLRLGVDSSSAPSGDPLASAGAMPEVAATLRKAVAWAGLAALGGIVVVFGMGVQIHLSIVVEPAYRSLGARDPATWLPAFWIGFTAGSLAAGHHRPLRRWLSHGWSAAAVDLDSVSGEMLGAKARAGFARWAPWAALLGTIAFAASLAARSPGWLALAESITGLAWGVLIHALFARSLALGGPARPASAAGLMFAALAIAAMGRLAVIAFNPGMPRDALASSLSTWPPMLWLAAMLALFAIRTPRSPA